MKNYLTILLVGLTCTLHGQAKSPLLPDSLSKYNIDPHADSLSLEEKVDAHQHLVSYGHKTKNDTVLFSAYFKLGMDYYLSSDYPKALNFFEEAENTSDRLGLPKLQSEARLKKGNVFLKLRQFEPALEQYHAYLGFVESAGDSIGLGRAFITMANCYDKTGRHGQASGYYLKGFSIIEKHGDSTDVAVAASNLSVHFMGHDQPEKAILFLNRVLNIDRQQGNQRGVTSDMVDLGRAYGMLGNYNKAEAYFDSSLTLAEQVGDAEIKFITYSWMADVAAGKGDYKSAFEHFTTYHNLRDSIIGERTQKEIAALRVKYETGRKETALLKSEAEVQRLEQERGSRNFRFWAMVVGLVGVAALALKFRRDQRKNKKLYQMEQELLQSRLEKEQLDGLTLKGKVAMQKQDLTNLSLEMSRRNAYAEELLERLGDLEKNANPSMEKEVRELRNLANNHFQLDKDREVFSTNIEQVNQEFYQKLAKQFGTLSPNELQLCGLLRLNFSNKDIASVKGISVNSAKMARYRLRKKFGLHPDEDIVAFLQEI